MTDRTIQHPLQLQSAKRASAALIVAAGGQVEAGREAGKHQSRMCSYGHVNTADFMPIDVVVALEAVTHGAPGHPHVARYLARQAGYALVRLPASPSGSTDWHREMGAVSREIGDIIEKLCTALADGKVTAQEVRTLRIREEIAKAQERLAALDALALRALDDDGGAG